MTTKRTSSERGGALLIVLWLSAALAAIALSVSTTVRAEIEHTSTVADGLRAHYLATGSLERGLQWMLWGGAPRNPDGTARFWDRSKPRMYMKYATGDVIVEMIPESAKLNINSTPEPELLKVITSLTGDPVRASAIVAGILDWRGPAQEAKSFDAYYMALGPTFRAPHASLQEIEELLSVRGVTPELFYGNYIADGQGQLYARGGLRDCFSVWGTRGSVDVNGASPAVLEAIGLSPAEVAQVVRRRTQKPFENGLELQDLKIPITRLRVGGGSMWTMRATARLKRPDGQPSETVRSAAVVVKYWDDMRGRSGPVQIIRYYGDGWSEFAATPPLIPGVFAPGVVRQ
jgi:general secretion pathway protein K